MTEGQGQEGRDRTDGPARGHEAVGTEAGGASVCPPWLGEFGRRQAECLVRSHRRWTGRDLWPGLTLDLDLGELARRVYEAPCVIVSHGTEADPVLNYGNARALALWEMAWADFTRTPSRFTAEAPERDERARLLAAVTADGFIDDYAGVRISSRGRRFRIRQATVWNLVTPDGRPCGQAATFQAWEWL